MRESVIYHHRLVDCQDHVVFFTEDGVNVFATSSPIQTCLNCGHSELPSEAREVIDSSISENRKNLQFTTRNFQLTKAVF